MFDIEAFPAPNDDFAPGLTPAPASEPDASGALETASARAAAAKRAEAGRKREERAKRREAGIPDPRTIDAAIIGAVGAACARRGHVRTIAQTKKLSGLNISLQDVVVGAMQELVEAKRVGQQQAKRAVLIRLGLGR